MAHARGKILYGGYVGKRAGGGGSPPAHLILLELKHRILSGISKLSDRDTQQIAVDDLERIVQSLSPEGILIFLGCLYDTDSQQKSIARRECVRLFGTVALVHGNFLAPYLPKVISCIIRRLKDPDTIVRDACVDAVGTIALNVDQESNTEDDIFEVMFKPLLEALSEQNKYVQIGAAMCLARLIESTSHPPLSSTQRLHPRILKLLKSSSFVAKGALLSVVGSFTQVQKAEADQLLATLLPHVQSSLESSDWSIRKAAVETLARIATRRRSQFFEHRSAALTALEFCRFDKVKPVRDSAVNAINLWKSLPVSETEIKALDANTGTKGTGRFANIRRMSRFTYSSNRNLSLSTQADEGGDSLRTKIAPNSPICRAECASSTAVPGSTIDTPGGGSTKCRVSFGSTKPGNSLFFRRSQRRSLDDWPIEVAVPKGSPPPNLVSLEQESKSQRMEIYGGLDMKTNLQDLVDEDPDICQLGSIKEIVSIDQTNKPQNAFYSKESDKEGLTCLQFQSGPVMEPIESDNDKIKHTERVGENCWIDHASQVILSEEQSWDSPVTLESPCSSTEYESTKLVDSGDQLASIQRQLARLEEQQSSIVDMLQALMGNSHESTQALKSRLQGLERVVDDVSKITARSYGDIVEKFNMTRSSKNADTVLHEGLKFSDVKKEPVKEKRENKAASHIMASEALYQQKECVHSCADHKNECSCNADTLEEVKTVKGDLGGGKLVEKDPKEASFSKVAKIPLSQNIWKHRKEEAALAFFSVDTEKACSRLSVKGGSSVLELKPSTPKSSLSSIGDQRKGDVKADAWDSWNRVLKHLQTDDINSAYLEVLASTDELLLVHLMARTGPALDQLPKATARQVLSTITHLLCKQSILDFALPWVQQIEEMVKSSGLDYFDLSAEANNLITRMIQGASHMDSAEVLFGCSHLNRLALQLQT